MGFVGCALVTFGIWQWSRPGACVAAGLGLIATAMWPDREKR